LASAKTSTSQRRIAMSDPSTEIASEGPVQFAGSDSQQPRDEARRIPAIFSTTPT
jgi:hypothetical protein